MLPAGRHDLLRPMFEGASSGGLAWGLRLSVWCAEEMPFETCPAA